MKRTLLVGVLAVLCGLAASQHEDHDHEHGQDPFSAVLHLLGGDENQNLTSDMSISLVKTMLDRVRCPRLEGHEESNFTCAECLTADGLIQLSLGESTDTVDEEGFHKMAVVLTVYLTDLSKNGVCTEGEGYQAMESRLLRYTQSKFTLSSYEQVLKDINTNYRVLNWGKCFTAESVFEELHINTSEASGGASSEELREIAAITVANVLEGLCIGEAELPETTFFLDNLFESLNGTNGTITVEALGHILSSFGIGGKAQPEPAESDDGHDDHDHAGHNHRRRRESPGEDEHDHDHDHTEDFDHTCFSSAQLMKLYLVEEEMGVTRDQFSAMAPALLQQAYSRVCVAETPTPNTTAPAGRELTALEKYGYGTLSVFLISLLALIGLLVLPMVESSVFKFIVQFGVGLGVGALSGDALLHLLPEAVGLHDHGDHTNHADHADHAEEDKSYMWKFLVTLGGIYFFFVFERVMSFIMPGGGHHEEGPVAEDVQLKKIGQLPTEEPIRGLRSHSISKQQLTNGESTTTLDPEMTGADTPNCFCTGCSPTAVMIIIGDVMCKFTDGLALGITFSGNLGLGLSTAIAVLAHELPHELGDFAMLIRCGMSYKAAVLCNVFSACWSFVGLYIGLAIGASFENGWLYALVAGMFLYVSLVEMLPKLLYHKSKSPIATFVVQNIGFLMGVTALTLIALYEEQIQMAITLE